MSHLEDDHLVPNGRRRRRRRSNANNLAPLRFGRALCRALHNFLNGVLTQEIALKEQGLMYSRLSIIE